MNPALPFTHPEFMLEDSPEFIQTTNSQGQLSSQNNTPVLCATCWAFVKSQINQKQRHLEFGHRLLPPKYYKNRINFVETANSYQKSWLIQNGSKSDIWYQKISLFFLAPKSFVDQQVATIPQSISNIPPPQQNNINNMQFLQFNQNINIKNEENQDLNQKLDCTQQYEPQVYSTQPPSSIQHPNLFIEQSMAVSEDQPPHFSPQYIDKFTQQLQQQNLFKPNDLPPFDLPFKTTRIEDSTDEGNSLSMDDQFMLLNRKLDNQQQQIQTLTQLIMNLVNQQTFDSTDSSDKK